MNLKLLKNFSYIDALKKADQVQVNLLKEMLILVDHNDIKQGEISKLDGHLIEKKNKFPHRAFSLFLFDKSNNFILQKRASKKITFPSLWTNACCSHPLAVPSEEEDKIGIKRAAVRRTKIELNLDVEVDNLVLVDKVLYRADSDKIFEEYEYDHVFVSRYTNDIKNIEPNKDEVDELKAFSIGELTKMVNDKPSNFTPWFANIFLNRGEYLMNSLKTIEKKDFNKSQFESGIKVRNCLH